MKQMKEIDPHHDRIVRALHEIELRITDQGRINSSELEALRRVIYDGPIDRDKANLLVEMHRRLREHTRGFEQFFYQAIKDHLLADGTIDAEETTWLRQMLLADGRIEDEQRTFLHQLRGEARQVGPEFEALYQEIMRQPPEQRTSG